MIFGKFTFPKSDLSIISLRYFINILNNYNKSFISSLLILSYIIIYIYIFNYRDIEVCTNFVRKSKNFQKVYIFRTNFNKKFTNFEILDSPWAFSKVNKILMIYI